MEKMVYVSIDLSSRATDPSVGSAIEADEKPFYHQTSASTTLIYFTSDSTNPICFLSPSTNL